MKRFGFYVSGKATTLKKYLKYYADGRVDNQIGIIISDNPGDIELKVLADLFKIKVLYFDFLLHKGVEKNINLSNFILNKFIEFKIDLGFIFGGKILKGDLLKFYKNRLINFHPAILPSFKGLKSIDQSLASNAFLLGNTAHIVVEEVDSGPVVMQNLLHRSYFCNYFDVLDKQIDMLHQIILWENQNRILIKDHCVIIQGADYSISEYVPRLEL